MNAKLSNQNTNDDEIKYFRQWKNNQNFQAMISFLFYFTLRFVGVQFEDQQSVLGQTVNHRPLYTTESSKSEKKNIYYFYGVAGDKIKIINIYDLKSINLCISDERDFVAVSFVRNWMSDVCAKIQSAYLICERLNLHILLILHRTELDKRSVRPHGLFVVELYSNWYPECWQYRVVPKGVEGFS